VGIDPDPDNGQPDWTGRDSQHRASDRRDRSIVENLYILELATSSGNLRNEGT
jgi:hypothetical protein